MTTDELVELCQALVGDLTLAQARKGLGVAKNLDDDQFILLMRFMAGERPVTRWEANTPIQVPHPQADDVDDDEDRPAKLDFDGITLL